jgi:hypothetical protein
MDQSYDVPGGENEAAEGEPGGGGLRPVLDQALALIAQNPAGAQGDLDYFMQSVMEIYGQASSQGKPEPEPASPTAPKSVPFGAPTR